MAIRYIAGGQFVGAPSDWDYPALAQQHGWNLRRVQIRDVVYPALRGEVVHLKRAPNRGHGCAHESTDGTVTCKECGVTASEFIAAAGDWLHERAEVA